MKIWILALAAAALCGGCVSGSPQAASGRQIVQRDCGACHAVDPQGESPMRAAPPFRTLGDKYDVEGLAEALAEGISVGHPTMPQTAYPPAQVAQVIAYLKQLHPSGPSAAP